MNWGISSPSFKLDIWHAKEDGVVYYDIHYLGKELPKELDNNLHKNNWHQLKLGNIAASKYKYYHLTIHCNTETVVNGSDEAYFNAIEKSLSDKNTLVSVSFVENWLEFIKNFSDNEYETNSSKLNKAMQSSTMFNDHSICIEELARELDAHKYIVFVEGSGMSAAGGVMTLIDFHDKLGLKTITGTSFVTDESMLSFLHNLLVSESKKEEYNKIIREFCASLDVTSKEETTRAHMALNDIVNALKTKSKEVIVYSGNFDGFLENAGLVKTAESEANEHAQLLKSKQSNLILVMLGLSVDHGGIIGKYKQHLPNAKVFMLNLKASSIVNFIDSQPCPLDIDGYVLGDLQENLPKLAEILGNTVAIQEKDQKLEL